MKGLSIINHPDFGSVRGLMENKEPWFVAQDVCKVLGLSKHRDAIATLDDDEKRSRPVQMDGAAGSRVMTIINESGLYSLIIQSRKPIAKAFKKWVTSEVLPSIRKYGYYIDPRAQLTTKERNAIRRDFYAELGKYVTDEDIHKCALKLRKNELDVTHVLRGAQTSNTIMADLQERAVANREKWFDAYSDDKIQEVLSKLK